jgi:radical SAM superfamily enzyme YgiQ (UPF0313 family)
MIVGLDRDGPDVFEQTLRFLGEARIDGLQLNVLTPLPGTELHADLDRQGRILDRDLSRYDFRHCVIRPARMTAAELQDGADWLYAQYYRLDRILLRFLRSLPVLGPAGSLLGLRLGLTYRYDNRREGIVGRNPARLLSPHLEGSLPPSEFAGRTSSGFRYRARKPAVASIAYAPSRVWRRRSM